MSRKSLLPNTFQKPNWMTDELSYLLSGDEVKVLDHVTRHILGWADKISTRRARLSLSHICEGFTTGDGTRFYGTGLNANTARGVLKSLCEFGLILKTAENDPGRNEGVEYGLPDDVKDECIARLWERRKKRENGNDQRTQKGLKAMRESSKNTSSRETEVVPSHETTPLSSHETTPLSSHETQQTQVKPKSNPLGAIAPRAPQTVPKHTDPLEHAFTRKEKVEAEGRWRTLLRGATRPGSERACEIAIAFAELTRIEPATQQQAKTALSAADQIVASGGTVDDMRAAWKVSQDPQKGFMVTDLHSLRGTVSALVAKQKRTGPQKPKRIGWTENDKGESVPVYEVAR
jgi:hypothetical protein